MAASDYRSEDALSNTTYVGADFHRPWSRASLADVRLRRSWRERADRAPAERRDSVRRPRLGRYRCVHAAAASRGCRSERTTSRGCRRFVTWAASDDALAMGAERGDPLGCERHERVRRFDGEAAQTPIEDRGAFERWIEARAVKNPSGVVRMPP